jgi:hypothetical protein
VGLLRESHSLILVFIKTLKIRILIIIGIENSFDKEYFYKLTKERAQLVEDLLIE